MSQDKRLENLVEAGWHVIDSEFDRKAIMFWRRSAFEFLEELLGPEHVATQSFLLCLRHSEAELVSKT
ncbi:MAG: hypothetical protein PHS86_00035 [Syntrophaceae bacterium]|nr:hypothetical protein [Syntrophaceae bacterium]